MAPDEILHLLPQIYHFFPVWIPIQKNTEYRPVRIQIGSISIIHYPVKSGPSWPNMYRFGYKIQFALPELQKMYRIDLTSVAEAETPFIGWNRTE